MKKGLAKNLPDDVPSSKPFSVEVDEAGRLSIVFEPDTGLGQDLFLEAYVALQKLKAEVDQSNRQKALAVVEEKAQDGNRWWPEEVQCGHCEVAIRLDQEPDAYVIFCEGCGGAVVVKPVEGKG